MKIFKNWHIFEQKSYFTKDFKLLADDCLDLNSISLPEIPFLKKFQFHAPKITKSGRPTATPHH